MVNLLILVRLKLLDLVKSSTFLNHHSDLVSLVQLLCSGQDVGNTIQDNSYSLVILSSEQVTEGLENSLKSKIKMWSTRS